MTGRFLALVVFALAALAGSEASACSLMLDASQSMQGFRSSPLFTKVVATLGRQCGEHFTFGAKLHPAPADLSEVAFKETDTALGPSLAEWLPRSHARRLLILTDNVADEGPGRRDGAQEEFYRLLGSPSSRFDRVAAVLMRLPFRGPIYSADDKRKGDYGGGARAVMLYVLERGGEGQAEGPLDTAGFGVSADNMAILSLKPFEPAGEAFGAQLDSSDRNVSFEDGGIVLARKSAGATYTFALKAAIRPSPRWNFGGLPLSATLDFPAAGPFAKPATTNCTVDPASAPAGGKDFEVKISCVATSALAAVDEAAQTRLGNRRAERDGALTVSLVGQNRDIALGPALEAWSFDGDGARLADPDPRVQGAIYRLGALLSGMSPRRIEPMVMRAPVTEKLYFFDPNPFLYGGLALALLGALALAAMAMLGPRRVEISGAAGGPITREVRGFARIDAPLDDRLRAAVWVLPGLILVMAGGEAPHLLPAGGGEVRLGRAQRRLGVRATASRTSDRKPPRRLPVHRRR